MKIINEDLASLKRLVQTKTQQLTDLKVESAVREIIANVIKNGDAAVKDYETQFDKVTLTDFKLSQTVIDDAYNNLDPQVKDALLL
ncbi:MAG: histidinol dehydrogenase, partial [Lactiplantibacillus plantarum]